jgi:hypothetical protein
MTCNLLVEGNTDMTISLPAIDTDDDVSDFDDNCTLVANADQAGSDGHAVGDACDEAEEVGVCRGADGT